MKIYIFRQINVDTTIYTKAQQPMQLILVVNVLWGMPQVQKPLKTSYSIFVKRHGVYTISYTTPRYYDETHKICYSHTSFVSDLGFCHAFFRQRRRRDSLLLRNCFSSVLVMSINQVLVILKCALAPEKKYKKKWVVQQLLIITTEYFDEARTYVSNFSDQSSRKRAETLRGTLKSWSWPAQPADIYSRGPA